MGSLQSLMKEQNVWLFTAFSLAPLEIYFAQPLICVSMV